MIKEIREYAFSNEHSLEERRFLLAGVSACVSVLAVLVSTILTNQGIWFSIGLAVALLIMIITVRTAILKQKTAIGSIIIILFSNLFVLPIGYLQGGGVYSGAPLWFVMGLVFVFVLFRGKKFWIFLIISMVSFAVAIYLGATHPEWVVPLQETNSIHADSYVAMVSVALLCGILYRFRGAVLERELKRAEEQAQEIENLNALQNTFFSSMSHEIRTPISTIIGLNEMTMREKVLPEEVLENTLNIQNASKMLLSLINDLLDMSKIQSGKMQIVPATYDTSRMLSEITNLHWSRATEKDLRFEIDVAKNIPTLLIGDDTRIKQIITNLLSNAIKYTEEGTVTMRFGGERIDENHFMLRVDVEDSGIGIRKEDIPYLFDSFRRVEGEDTKNIEGTGLGLAISKQLAELMDGTITVNSIYTKGSTFRFEVPQEIASESTEGVRAPGVLARERPDYQQAFEAPKASVLVVDDNDMNRIVCRKLLRATRVQVDLAESGKECLEKTRQKHYDAIFMDHEMPQMDGIETLRQLRQQSNGLCRNTPVIALTANAGSDRNAFYIEKGFSAYLAKPIQSSRLESLLLACLPPDLVEQNYLEEEKEVLQVSETLMKRAFLITTDTLCDLPDSLLKENEILVMPYYLMTERGRFRDVEEIDAENLQHLLRSTGQSVHSMPAPVEEYESFFAEALTNARFVLHLSSIKSASSAYEHAARAAESFGNVRVIDSGMISSGLGMMAIRASELFRSGLRLEEVLPELERYRTRISLQYLVPSLSHSNTKYKISFLVRLLMHVFNLEPVFTVRRGRLALQRFLLGYVRSTPDQFVYQCLQHAKNINTKRLFVTFSGCTLEKREHVLREIEQHLHFDEVIVVKASAATFSNCGADSFGLIYEWKAVD